VVTILSQYFGRKYQKKTCLTKKWTLSIEDPRAQNRIIMKNALENISLYTAELPSDQRTIVPPGKISGDWQKKQREALGRLLGIERFRAAPPALRIRGVNVCDDHILYDMTMETEPGVNMPFFVLTPPDGELLTGSLEVDDSVCRKFLCDFPAVIVPHGHGSDGRYGVAGIVRHEDLNANTERYNHDLGLQFVRRGYVVFCPDARGSGDRRNPKEQGSDPKSLLSSSCNDLNNALISLGTSLTAAWCWDLMALTNLIMEKGWGDPERIGVCGFSGGGLQALFYSALDRRIRCTGVSGYFFKFEDCMLDSNMCGCNFIPSFPLHFDMAALGALIAPGALIIEKGISDPLNGRRGIIGPRELIEVVQRVYRELGREEYFMYSEVEGGHRFSGQDIFGFFDSHMKE